MANSKFTKGQLIELIVEDDLESIANDFSGVDHWIKSMLIIGNIGYRERAKAELVEIAKDRGLLDG